MWRRLAGECVVVLTRCSIEYNTVYAKDIIVLQIYAAQRSRGHQAVAKNVMRFAQFAWANFG